MLATSPPSGRAGEAVLLSFSGLAYSTSGASASAAAVRVQVAEVPPWKATSAGGTPDARLRVAIPEMAPEQLLRSSADPPSARHLTGWT